MRDNQRARLYYFEIDFIETRINKKLFGETPQEKVDNAQRIVDYIWQAFGEVNPPKVCFSKTLKTCSNGNRYKINLIESMLDEITLIHELGHSLANREHLNKCEAGHGPIYVADYMSIVCGFYGFSECEISYGLNKFKVDMDMNRFYFNLRNIKETRK